MSSEQIKILLVEDNPGDARLIREILAESEDAGFEIDWAPRLSTGLEKLGQGGIDLVLLDLGLPDSRGLETFVRAYAHAPGVPFVVLTGLNDETVALSAVREGAQDYLIKGQTDGVVLLRAIRYATERKKVEEELRRANEELRQEIGDRRAAERAVEAERQRLFALLDGLPALVHLKAPDFSIRFANRFFRKIFGDWEGKRCFELVQGRNEPCEYCSSIGVFETGIPTSSEWNPHNGNQIYQTYNYPFADVDGSSLVLTLGIDISQRKQVEEALKESERKYRLLVSTIPAVVFKGYADWSIDFFDGKIVELTGYEREDFISRRLKWSDLILEEDLDEARQAFVKALKHDGAYVREYRIRDKEGRIIWIQARGRIVFKPDGRIDHVSGVFFDISQRKAAEEALRVSEEKYRLLVGQIPAVVFKGYADWSVDFFDKKIEAITGYSKEDFDSRRVRWCDLIPAEDLDYAHNVFREALKNNRSYVREHRLRRKDGEIRWVQCRGQIFCDAAGKVEYIHGVTFDVTDRRRAEEALRQSEARLAKAQSLAHLGHWECDLNSDQALCSDEIYRIFGVDPEQFTPSFEGVMSYVHPDDVVRVRHRFAESLATTKPFSLVSRIVRPDGSVRYIHSQAEVVFDERGKPRRMLGTAQDITERRTAEMRLRDSEARFRGIFEGAAMGIGLTDMQGRFLTANRTFQEMLSYGMEELRGKTCLDFTHADDLDKSREVFRKLVSGQQDRFQMEKRFQRKDGQYFWVRVTVSLVKDPKDRPLYTIGMVEDITQARQAEERLQESEMRLRHLASELMTAQEDERRRISRELHDEMGQSLLVLKLQARAIARDLTPEQAKLKRESQEMLANLDQVVDNVRRLSRDLSPTILEDLGLTAALQRLIREFSKHYHVEFCTQENDGIDDLFPPATQVTIYRIFQESLTNIGKHSQATKLMVAINKSGGQVSFLIRDNGRGFNPEQRRRQAPGQGMGLAAMEERARMMGGALSIWSQEGSGTSISFSIPYFPKTE